MTDLDAVVIAERGLNVRTEPTTHATVVTQLPPGSKIKLVPGAVVEANGYRWRRMIFGGDESLWVAEKPLAADVRYLEIEQRGVQIRLTNPDHLPVVFESWPDGDNPVIMYVTAGEEWVLSCNPKYVVVEEG